MCRFLLYLGDRKVSYLAGKVCLCYSVFRRVGICWRGFSSWRDFFSYFHIFCINIGYLLSCNPKKDSSRNKHYRSANQSQIISYVAYLYACMQNHNDDTIKTSDTVLRKIYLSLYLKGLCVRGSWRPNRTATY